MKKILQFIVNGLAVIGFVAVALSATGWTMLLLREKPKLPESIILSLDLGHKVEEKSEENLLRSALSGEKSPLVLRDIIAALDLASHDPRVKVLLGKFGSNNFSLAEAQEIRDAVQRLNAEGKPSIAFAPSFGEMAPADKAYYLASGFNEIWLQPAGLLGITGFAAEAPFAKKAMEKIGVGADFARRSEYKSLMESVTEDDLSPANAEQLGELLDDLSMQFDDDVAAARRMSPEVISWLIDAAPLSAPMAQQSGFVDQIGYEDEIEDKLYDQLGAGTKELDAAEYLAKRRDELRHAAPKNEKLPVVALIHAAGNIVQQGGDMGPVGNAIAADEIVDAFAAAVADDEVEAVLLRIDSPGGSAVASESIRRALVRAELSGLPVIVSMGSVAGSGAYWVASAADMILADPATLTGSIGVIAGKFYGKEIWDKLGIAWSQMSRGDNADLWSMAVPFTQWQHNKVDALVGDAYNQFKQHVAEGRDLSDAAVEAVARGRVWTGNQALNLGLVDELGGFYDAVEVSKNLIGLTADDPVLLKIYPAPKSLAERLQHLFGHFGRLGAQMAEFGNVLEQFMPALHKIFGATQVKGRELTMPDLQI